MFFLYFKKLANDPDPEPWGITNSVGVVALSLAQLDYPGLSPGGKAVKILHLCTCLYAYLVFTMYTADLTSRLTVLPTEASFDSMQEALDNGYKIIIRKGEVCLCLHRTIMQIRKKSFVTQ